MTAERSLMSDMNVNNPAIREAIAKGADTTTILSLAESVTYTNERVTERIRESYERRLIALDRALAIYRVMPSYASTGTGVTGLLDLAERIQYWLEDEQE
jgi:hypothetical protein